MVNENGEMSDQVHLAAGTPQGSCMSPVLYLIFVNDLSEGFDQFGLKTSQYADDVSLRATCDSSAAAANMVQKGLTSLETWCKKWQVAMNPSKSKLVLFTRCPRHKKEGAIDVKLFGESIPFAPEAEFLGVTFDSYLTWEAQTAKIVARAYTRLNLIRIVSGLTKEKNPTVLLKLYQSIILSVYEYSSICLISAAECHLEKLQLQQNQALRCILNLPAYVSIKDLHDASGIKLIKDHLIYFAQLRLRAMQVSSEIVKDSILCFDQVQHIKTNCSPLDILIH